MILTKYVFSYAFSSLIKHKNAATIFCIYPNYFGFSQTIVTAFIFLFNTIIMSGWSKLIVGWKTLEITLGMFSESDLLL